MVENSKPERFASLVVEALESAASSYLNELIREKYAQLEVQVKEQFQSERAQIEKDRNQIQRALRRGSARYVKARRRARRYELALLRIQKSLSEMLDTDAEIATSVVTVEIEEVLTRIEKVLETSEKRDESS